MEGAAVIEIKTDPVKVAKWVAVPEQDLRRRLQMSAQRFGSLVQLQAPNFIIEMEMLMLMERFQALRMKLGYDPEEEMARYGTMTSGGPDDTE